MKIGLVQLNSGPTVAENLEPAAALIREAAGAGAVFIATPENTCRLAENAQAGWAESFAEKDHPAISFYAALAKELAIDLLIGSIASIRVGENKLANRSYLFGPGGQVKATYDKIHMFDVDLPTGESHRESATIQPGEKAVVSDVAGVKIGLTVCYDLRFAHLFRKLAKKGAHIIAVPAAFTVPTGQAHWEVLLRARAIETGAFIIAPAQGGQHIGARKTYGHSLVVNPWGEVIAHKDDDAPGILLCEIDPTQSDTVRAAIPSLTHDRDYS